MHTEAALVELFTNGCYLSMAILGITIGIFILKGKYNGGHK